MIYLIDIPFERIGDSIKKFVYFKKTILVDKLCAQKDTEWNLSQEYASPKFL